MRAFALVAALVAAEIGVVAWLGGRASDFAPLDDGPRLAAAYACGRADGAWEALSTAFDAKASTEPSPWCVLARERWEKESKR